MYAVSEWNYQTVRTLNLKCVVPAEINAETEQQSMESNI